MCQRRELSKLPPGPFTRSQQRALTRADPRPSLLSDTKGPGKQGRSDGSRGARPLGPGGPLPAELGTEAKRSPCPGEDAPCATQ